MFWLALTCPRQCLCWRHKKYFLPAFALFRTTPQPIALQAVHGHFREEHVSYINICLHWCVSEEARVCRCRVTVTHGFTASILILLPAVGTRNENTVTCTCARILDSSQARFFCQCLKTCMMLPPVVSVISSGDNMKAQLHLAFIKLHLTFKSLRLGCSWWLFTLLIAKSFSVWIRTAHHDIPKWYL